MKLKKKKLLFILFFFLIIGFVSLYFGYLHLKEVKQEKIKDIQSHYGEFALVQEGALLYEKKENEYVQAGRVLANTILPMDAKTISSLSDTYFPILGTDYYLFYQSVVPALENHVTKLPDYYLNLGKKIITKNETKMYQKDRFILFLEATKEFEVLYADDSYYYVFYMGDIFGIKKEDVIIEDLPQNEEEASYISVVEFAKYDSTCRNSSCISNEKVEKILESFQESGCYSITESEYLGWLNHDLRLKHGAILVTLEKEDAILNQSIEKFGYEVSNTKELTFVNNDSSTKKDTKKESVNRYFIHENMIEEQINKVIDGVTIEKPKTVVTGSSKGLPSMDALASSIAVLNYHFFFDSSANEVCPGNNCLDVKDFRAQLDYLNENHYKTLTMEEYRAWMYHEIELPARSVLITIDDGAMGTGKHNGNKLIPILEEYQMHATLFLITGWWSIENYQSPYLDIESHTNDMHTEGFCKNQIRGAKLLCMDKEQVMDDLRKSLAVTSSNKAFCFPFYAYNDSSIEILKEVGFQLGFIGGYMKSNRNQDKYKITRYPIHRNTSLNQFMNMIH